MARTVRVWDLPTRLFHWLLVACIVGSVITGTIGGAQMDWHARIGYAVLTLLLFRIAWGFAGGHWSRFSSFLAGPSRIASYLRGDVHPDALLGHNPLGALSVLAMIVMLLVQVATGLVGDDEIAFTGPLNKFVSTAQGLAATSYHKRVGQWAIYALVALHLGAVLFYLWRRKNNLVRPMISGDKPVAGEAMPSRDDAGSRLVALVVFVVCGGAVAWLVQLGR